jgi:hypothetical protein
MRRVRITTSALAAFLLLSAATLLMAESAPKGKAYGEPLGARESVKISELMANPDLYLGQTVQVDGLVTGVCEKRGCWMSLASDVEFQELRIKVDDGVIVFPIEAKGRRATAEGQFTKIEMTLEQTRNYRAHHAEEHGEEFDPSTVTEPMTYYQIMATGAVIH